MRGGDSLAPSWLRHHPPKKLPSSPREARARRFASRAAPFSPSPLCSSSCWVCWSIVYGRQSRPSDGSGVPRVNDGVNTDCALARRVRHLRLRHLPAEDHRHDGRDDGIDADGNTVLLNDKFRITRCPQPRRRHHPLPPVLDQVVGQPRQARRVPRRLRHQAHRHRAGACPPDQGGDKWSTKDTKCDGKDTELITSGSGTTTPSPDVYHDVVTDFNNIRITNDGMVFVVAFVPKGTDIPQPDWAAQLPTLGAADGGSGDRARRRPLPARPTSTAPRRARRSTRSRHDVGDDERRRRDDEHDGTGDDHHRRLMRAVVLVGGFGTRLRPLTLTTPKPMLPVGHVPIIERLVDNLAKGGVTDVTLALGFKPEPFVEAFPERRVQRGRAALRGRAGAARHRRRDPVRRRVQRDRRHVRRRQRRRADRPRHRRARRLPSPARSAEATIHLIGVDDPSSFGVVATDGDGRVERFVEKPAPGTAPSNLINAGTYVLEPSVLQRIPAGAEGVDRARHVSRGASMAGVSSRWRPTTTGSTPAIPSSTCRPTSICSTARGRCTRASRVHSGAHVDPTATVTAASLPTASSVAARRNRHRFGRCCAGAVVGAAGSGGKLGGHGQDRRAAPASPTRVLGLHGRVDAGRAACRANSGLPPTRRERTGRRWRRVPRFAPGRSTHRRGQHRRRRRRPVQRLAGQPCRRPAAGGALKIHTLDVLADEFAALVGHAPARRRLPPGLAAARPRRCRRRPAARCRACSRCSRRRGPRGRRWSLRCRARRLYGEVPLRDLPIKEGHAWNPVGVHGVVAKAVVDLLNLYRAEHAVEFTALAMSTVYGPRQRADGGVVGSFAHALRDGHQPGDPRRRASDARLRLRRRRGRRAGPSRLTAGGGLVVNVGTGVSTSIRDLWTMMAGPSAAGRRSARRGDPTTSPGSRCRRRGRGSTWRGRRGPTCSVGLRSLG